MKKQVKGLMLWNCCFIGVPALIALFSMMNLFFSSYEKRMIEDGVVFYEAAPITTDVSHSEEKILSRYFTFRCSHERSVNYKTDGDSKLELGDKVRVSLVETYKRKYPWPFSFTWVYDSVRAEDVVFVERPPSTKVPMFCDENNRCLIYFSLGGITATTEPK